MNESSLPLIVQSDRTVLLELNHPQYEEVRDKLSRFAEIEKSPEYVHTYRITPLSIWNAAATGLTFEEVVFTLKNYNKYPVPPSILQEIKRLWESYGKVKLIKRDGSLILNSSDSLLIEEIWNYKPVKPFLLKKNSTTEIEIKANFRGHLKQALIHLGYPVEDLAGYRLGDPLTLHLLTKTQSGVFFNLRYYQQECVDLFYAGGTTRGGSGVIVLPCGAGKTLVGLATIEKVSAHTLILCTNITAARQWRSEIIDKTDLSENEIGEYSGEKKELLPITIATYQILTYRRDKTGLFEHFEIFNKRNWGLIIYDEVHLLPAPVFRITAEIQATRRLGLTATLIREDGKEKEVFSLIGPKKYDVPWKVLEKQGWIAQAQCIEIRIPLPAEQRKTFAVASLREKFKIASLNSAKTVLILQLIREHSEQLILVIGQFIEQLENIARVTQSPLITGKTKNADREDLYDSFRKGRIKVLVVSKVANFAVDLPAASVAIQVSGTYGSRQEEAQRLGRILRPKKSGQIAYFYSLVTHDSEEQEFASHRQLFLTEQGYQYRIHSAEEWQKTALNKV